MNIAVVGDVHGHLALMYAVLGRWQHENGCRIDLILQLGDLGVFVPASKLDQATKRYEKRDPEELGFADFAGPNPPETLLDPRPLLVFIPGNHEDFLYLQEASHAIAPGDSVYTVSEDGKICALRSGRVLSYEADGEQVRVAGVSGVGTRRHKKALHPATHLAEADALSLAETGPSAFDVLISHDAPSGLAGGPRGSVALRIAIEEVQPSFAFFAHYDWSHQDRIGTTEVHGLGSCSYNVKAPADDWPVLTDGLAIVRWTRGKPQVERLVPEWLKTATRRSWRHWKKDIKKKRA